MNVLKGLGRDRDAEREREDLLRQIKGEARRGQKGGRGSNGEGGGPEGV